MRAVRQSTRLTLAGALAILPIAAELLWKLLIHPRPFWIHYDPEAIYFYQSLRLLDGLAPSNVDHPGTTLQILGAAVALFTGRSPLQFEAFLAAAFVVALALMAGAAILMARTLFRDSSPWLAAVAVWGWFLTPRALQYDMIWTAEILYFPLGVVMLIAVARALAEGCRARDIALAGAAIGVCLATKFVFLGWAAAFIATARRRWMALAGIAAGFAVAALPALTQLPYMLGWVWQNATHAGAYGRGELAAPDTGAAMRAYAGVLAASKGWLLWIAAAGVLLWIARRALDRRLVLFAVIGGVLSFLLPFRSVDSRYLLPCGVAVMALIYAARAVPRGVAIAVCALAGLLLAKNLADDAREHRLRIEVETALRRQIDTAVQRLAPGGVVIYAWRVPEPSFALRIQTTDARQLDAIAARYPREGHFNDSPPRLFLPPGAARWDVLVIDQAIVSRFPEPLREPAATVGRYRLFLNPR